MLLKDLKIAKTKLEADIGTEVIKLLNQFRSETGCDIEDVSFSFHQKCEPLKEPVNVLTNVTVGLVI
tara:strand:+ start:1375 stop:1575 length:201 start_codon:yes stop_codon:yes gene_type:complete